MGIWAATGAGVLASWAGRWRPRAGIVVSLLLVLTCLLPLRLHWRSNDQHDFRLLAHYVHDSLKYADPNAFVFTGRADSFSSPVIYYQVVMGYRPDVVILDYGTLSSPVLARRLSEKAPDLVAACREEMAAVAAIARRAELGQPYDVVTARQAYRDFRRKLVEEAVNLRTTYVTSDLFRHPMFAGFNLISEGLVARVAREDEFRPLPLTFAGPDLVQQDIRDERERNVFADYSVMLRNRAHYLRLHGKTDEATELEKRAVYSNRTLSTFKVATPKEMSTRPDSR